MWKYSWNKLELVYSSWAALVNLQCNHKLWQQHSPYFLYQHNSLHELSLNGVWNHSSIYAGKFLHPPLFISLVFLALL